MGNIGFNQLEGLLKKYHSDSMQSKVVIFDMSQLTFIGCFELSIILTWIHKLVKSDAGKDVRVWVPRPDEDRVARSTIIEYFRSWQVWEAFECVGAKIENTSGINRKSKNTSQDIFSKKYVAFKFYASSKDYQTFLDGLADEQALNTIFQESAKLSVVGSGGLKNIILEEICKNSFEHGDGFAAHIAIGRLGGIAGNTECEQKKNLEKRLLAVPEHTKAFYKNLGSSDCLEIVVSDAGTGIPKKLAASYKVDSIITDKKRKPNAVDLIEYAFLLHSTSKKDSWYSNFAEVQKEPDYKLPRGLYFVKNIAMRNNALLVCRSGNGLACWDFLSSSDGLPLKANFQTGLKNTRYTNLGGTQIQMLIPINAESGLQRNSISVPNDIPKPKTEAELVFFNVADEIRSGRTARDSKKFVGALHQFVHKFSDKKLIILDFIGTHWTKDALFPVICEIGHICLDGKMIGAIHTKQFDAVMDEMWIGGGDMHAHFRGSFAHALRPMLRLSIEGGNFSVDIPGIFELSSGNIDPEEIKHYLNGKGKFPIPEILDCLFCSDGDHAKFRYSLREIENEIKVWRGRLIDKMLSEPSFNVLHNGKYLLPTGPYAEQFYEISTFLQHPDSKALLNDALNLEYEQIHYKGTEIVCISKVGGMIGALLHETAVFKDESNIQIIEDPLFLLC